VDNKKHYAKVEIEFTEIYRKTDDCVFPYYCICDDCMNGTLYGVKYMSMEIDNAIFMNALKNYREVN